VRLCIFFSLVPFNQASPRRPRQVAPAVVSSGRTCPHSEASRSWHETTPAFSRQLPADAGSLQSRRSPADAWPRVLPRPRFGLISGPLVTPLTNHEFRGTTQAQNVLNLMLFYARFINYELLFLCDTPLSKSTHPNRRWFLAIGTQLELVPSSGRPATRHIG
jgi:hypothetical protein